MDNPDRRRGPFIHEQLREEFNFPPLAFQLSSAWIKAFMRVQAIREVNGQVEHVDNG